MLVWWVFFLFRPCASSTLDTVLPNGPACEVMKTNACAPSGLRVGVVSLSTTLSNRGNRFTAFLNELYTARHGYALLTERCSPDTRQEYLWRDSDQRSIVWSKSLVLLKHLPYYDYLLFLDSDAFVVDLNYTVGTFIKDHWPEGASIVTQPDCYDSTANGCWTAQGLNTGVMLVKHTPVAVEILRTWAESADDERCRKYHWQHPREQLCLNDVAKTFAPSDIQAVNASAWMGLDGTWIKHVFIGVGITEGWYKELTAKTFGYVMAQMFPAEWPIITTVTSRPSYQHTGRAW